MLTGSSTAAPTLSAAGAQLSSGSVVDLGLAERGSTASKSFRIANTTSERVRVQSASVTGKHFKLAQALPIPFELAPGATYDFDVAFAPTASGVFEGALVIDERSLSSHRRRHEPAFPKPTIVVDLASSCQRSAGKGFRALRPSFARHWTRHAAKWSFVPPPEAPRMNLYASLGQATARQRSVLWKGPSSRCPIHVSDGNYGRYDSLHSRGRRLDCDRQCRDCATEECRSTRLAR